MQFSTEHLIFGYKPNKHLSSDLTITNTSKSLTNFKFKASTAHRFIIKPSTGSLQPNESATIQIIIHRQIVENCENEKLQILYGSNLDEADSMIFKLGVGQTQKQDRINLTMMVEDKSSRIKKLQEDIEVYQEIPVSKQPKSKGMNLGLKALLILLIGVLVGFFAPLKIFKRKIKS